MTIPLAAPCGLSATIPAVVINPGPGRANAARRIVSVACYCNLGGGCRRRGMMLARRHQSASGHTSLAFQLWRHPRDYYPRRLSFQHRGGFNEPLEFDFECGRDLHAGVEPGPGELPNPSMDERFLPNLESCDSRQAADERFQGVAPVQHLRGGIGSQAETGRSQPVLVTELRTSAKIAD